MAPLSRPLPLWTLKPGYTAYYVISGATSRRFISNSKSTATPDIPIPQQGASVAPTAHNNAPPPALSALPFPMLLRSLFINTVSSHPLLLSPTLRALKFLCKPGRTWIFDVDRNPLLHAILKATFYRQFCAGESPSETRAVVQSLKDLGLRGVILTYAKETVFDVHDKAVSGPDTENLVSGDNITSCPSISAWREGTLKTIDLVDEGDYLALK